MRTHLLFSVLSFFLLFAFGQRGLSQPTNVTANDPRSSSQWNLKKISAPQAWALTTGSPEVVVAVIDTGIDYKHPDLAPNMWRNPGETGLDANGKDKATNKIDNDGNGYIDDVYGVDLTIPKAPPTDNGDHGTGLAGIIGAVGNNRMGIAGINWNVKLMSLVIRNGTVKEFRDAVGYVIDMKKRGVNVRVISNSYFNEGRYPLADVINAAGAEDILTVIDSDNTSYNDDVWFFDSPKTQYTIVIAGSNPSDSLVSYSGYGKSTVDLAAPTEVPSTSANGGYISSFSGTSAAQPHGAGAAALLAAFKPDATALEIKAALKRGVDHIPALANKTITGGRLNIAGALHSLTNTDLPPIVVGVIPVSDQTQPDDTIEVLFSQPMDRGSVESAFQINPSVAGSFLWTNDDRTLQFVHGEPFKKELFTTNYACRILATAHDKTGKTLDGNFDTLATVSPADDFIWTFSLHLANDDFENAEPISEPAGSIVGTTRYSTAQNGEPYFSSAMFYGLSVWYQWVANESGWESFDVFGVSYDSVLGVFIGSQLSTVSTNAFGDNYGSLRSSRVSFPVTKGQRYMIKVAGKYPGTTIDTMWGNFVLHWYPTPAPSFATNEFSPLAAAPGETVSFFGTNFTGAEAVLFNGIQASFASSKGSSQDLSLQAIVPTNAISGPITIITPHGSAITKNDFAALSSLNLVARAYADDQVELKWPTNFVTAIVEGTDALGPNALWKAVPLPSSRSGVFQGVFLPSESGNRYFRLHQP